jgi:hypothetical protein
MKRGPHAKGAGLLLFAADLALHVLKFLDPEMESLWQFIALT